MDTYKFQYFSSLDKIISLFILFYAFSEYINAYQQNQTTFGLISELKIQKHAIGIIVGDFNGNDIEDFASYGGEQVRFFYQIPESLSFKSDILFTKKQIVAALSTKLNKDKISDIILIFDNPPTISTYIGKSQGTFTLFDEKEISNIPENMLTFDINGDGKNDLIFYGKKTLGIDVYLGNGNGTFRDKIILFPEYSFNTLSAINIHDLKGVSIVASDWLSNDVLIFSNFGKLKFSDPIKIHLSSEPTSIKCTDLNNDENIDLLVDCSDEKIIYTYLGDEYGGFEQGQLLTINYVPDKIDIADVNNDGSWDLGILNKQSKILHLYLNDGKGKFKDDVPFFAGASPSNYQFYKSGNDGLWNAAVIDTANNRIRVFYNARNTNTTTKEQIYGVGTTPICIMSVDIDNDGWNDIIVANSKSNNVSLLLNDHKGNLKGQISFQLKQSPNSLNYYSITDTEKIIATSNTFGTLISVIEVNPKTFSYKYFELPCNNIVDVLEILNNDHLSFIIFENEKSNNVSTIVKYEKISNQRFIQKVYDLRTEELLHATLMLDSYLSHKKQLFYLQYNKKLKKQELFVSDYLPNDEFSNADLINSIEASEGCITFLKTANLNNDKLKDLIVYIGEPENKIYIYSHKDAKSPMSLTNILDGIKIDKKDDLKCFDINNDGYVDIIYKDKINELLYVRYGKNNRTFSDQIKLASIADMGSFCFADMDKDTYPELIISNIKNGTVQIVQLKH